VDAFLGPLPLAYPSNGLVASFTPLPPPEAQEPYTHQPTAQVQNGGGKGSGNIPAMTKDITAAPA